MDASGGRSHQGRAGSSSGPGIGVYAWRAGDFLDLIFAYQCERCLRLHRAACTLRRQEGAQLCGSRFARASGCSASAIRFFRTRGQSADPAPARASNSVPAGSPDQTVACTLMHVAGGRRARHGGLELSPTPERCAEPTRPAPCECSVRIYINYLNNARG